MTDEQLEKMKRGGHDPEKVYAAFKAAVEHKGRPTVILAHTVKGYGLGEAGEGKNIAHQTKKMDAKHLIEFRNRFGLAVPDEAATKAAFYKPAEESEEIQYLKKHREALGGPSADAARCSARTLQAPGDDFVKAYAGGSGDKKPSTTGVFVDMLARLLRDPNLGKWVVPIVPDEARTFGMDPFFSKYKIYSNVGQLYDPVDAEFQQAAYREAKDGQLLEEGITEAGSMSSFIAAGTAYATHGVPTIPFYIYYSMFGFQRIGDLIWAAADMRTRGFLLGGDGRPHHAQRRGPAARGRPQPPPGRHRADDRGLRPGDGVRAGRHRPRRHPPHVRGARKKTSSTTSLSTTIITRCCRCRKARPRAS